MSMNEAPYSANFQMFLSKLKVQFTYRQEKDDAYIGNLKAYIANLYADGFTDDPSKKAAGKTHTVSGYVVGEYTDKKSGNFEPVVYLYTEYSKYKVASVYPESFGQLPFTVNSANWNGQAPEREDAQRRKALIPTPPFEVELEPELDFTGEPRTTENGNIKYKLARVVGAVTKVTPPNGNGNGHHSPANGKPAATNKAGDDLFGDKAAGPRVTQQQLNDIQALGEALFGLLEWPKKLSAKISSMGVKDAKAISQAQAREIIETLSMKLTGNLYDLGDGKPEDWLNNATKTIHKGKGIHTIAGAALADAYMMAQQAELDFINMEEIEEAAF